MSKNAFFDDQSDATAVKIKFYRDYIEGYLFKVLMQFGKCVIADLFCGRGKNGNVEGSPLVLIEEAKKVLQSDILLQRIKKPIVAILFNDKNTENIKNLKSELSKIKINENIDILAIESDDFSIILNNIKSSKMFKENTPKFFFLDPFGYSKFEMSDLKFLMELPNSEVLFFLPAFSAYRFIGSVKIPLKLEEFLSDFTSKGRTNYEDIYDFSNSIVDRIKKELNLEFVWYLLLDMGRTKNALFFLTKHVKGMLLMNRLFLKSSDDGSKLDVKAIKKRETTPPLFPKSQVETLNFKMNVENFKKKFESELKNKKEMLNTEIIKFSAIEGFLPIHANDALLNLRRNDKIEVKYLTAKFSKGFYVSEAKWHEELSVIKYLD